MRALLALPLLTVPATAPAQGKPATTAEAAVPPAPARPGATKPPAPIMFGPYPPAWQVDIGPGLLAVPEYPGANALRILPIPQLDIRYRNQFFASVQSGVGYNLVNTRRFRAGPIIRPEFGRTARDIARFPGLNRIGATAELGAFATWQPNLFTSVQLEVRQAVSGHGGLLADLSLRRVKLKGKWTLGYGGRLRFADARYMRSYYAVTPAQAGTSGLAVYNPGATITDVSVSGFASRRIGGNWNANVFASYARLVGDAADAPITRSRFGSANQIVLGASLSYRFRFK